MYIFFHPQCLDTVSWFGIMNGIQCVENAAAALSPKVYVKHLGDIG